jgi:hypothetical protein
LAPETAKPDDVPQTLQAVLPGYRQKLAGDASEQEGVSLAL